MFTIIHFAITLSLVICYFRQGKTIQFQQELIDVLAKREVKSILMNIFKDNDLNVTKKKTTKKTK